LKRPSNIHEKVFDFWGWRVKFGCDSPDLNQDLLLALPSDKQSLPESTFDRCFFLRTHSSGRFRLERDGELFYSDSTLTGIINKLEMTFQHEVATQAPHAVFVHAGVVSLNGRALLLPGPGFSGKSTLTRALMALGAQYYSDEYAVLDLDGQLHPYRRRLTLRRSALPDRRVSVNPHPDQNQQPSIKLVVFCPFRKWARWKLEPISPGRGTLGLFSNTVTAQLSPIRDLSVLREGTRQAQFFQGHRGDAKVAAQKLLALLENL